MTDPLQQLKVLGVAPLPGTYTTSYGPIDNFVCIVNCDDIDDDTDFETELDGYTMKRDAVIDGMVDYIRGCEPGSYNAVLYVVSTYQEFRRTTSIGLSYTLYHIVD